tara:strand:+ start:14696 stop:15283 length:588 start_codon:yes stop_codon:yes gene_type:complete
MSKGILNKNLLFLDLELNRSNDDSNKGQTTDIIQIGACVLEYPSLNITNTFNEYIKIRTPLDNGELRISNFIESLTGISDKIIEEKAICLDEAIEKLNNFITDNNCFSKCYQWGSGDLKCIKEQSSTKLLLWNEFDVKALHQTVQMAKVQSIRSGLSKSMIKYGLNFKGKKHNALDDSINTARIYKEILNRIKGI